MRRLFAEILTFLLQFRIIQHGRIVSSGPTPRYSEGKDEAIQNNSEDTGYVPGKKKVRQKV